MRYYNVDYKNFRFTFLAQYLSDIKLWDVLMKHRLCFYFIEGATVTWKSHDKHGSYHLKSHIQFVE